MRKFTIRQVETVRTTAATYGCECCPTMPWCGGDGSPVPIGSLPDHCGQAV